jgi:endogenous inhibitor of DNA gyrase (YacG/DUF329 family)
MAMVQLKCPETGKLIDIRDVPPEYAHAPMATVATHREIPCPYCGKGHIWTSSHFSHAMIALRDSPDATRVVVEPTLTESVSATALP